MSTDADSIRAAFATIAGEAPEGDRIQAVLTRRARTARQRRIVLRLAGAGAAATVVGGAALGVREVLEQGPDHPDITVPGGPGGGWLTVPWQFRPGWLPGGFGAAGYSMMVVGSEVSMVSRTWRSGQTTVSLLVGWGDGASPLTGRRTSAVVDGVRADVYDDGSNTFVSWQRMGRPVLTVGVGGSTDRGSTDHSSDGWRNQALKVARSLRHDGGHGYVGPRPAYLPPAYAPYPWLYTVGYEGLAWRQSLVLNGDGHGMAQISVDIGPHVYDTVLDQSKATPATVRGLPGWTLPEQNQVFVTLTDGREVYALGGLDSDGPQVLRMVDELDPGPVPDMTWVGTR